MQLKDRFPSRSEIFPVYSVIVFWSYTWSILIFMFNLPSWILLTRLGEILGYFSYGVVFTFFDTLLMLGLILGTAFVLPCAWLRDDFVAVGSAIAGLLFFWVTIIQMTFGTLITWPASRFWLLLCAALASLIVSVVVIRRLPLLRKPILWLASSAGIFVYIYGFITMFGIVVVLIRNVV